MVEICLSSMHPTTLLPARSHGNPYIFYEVANSALLPDVTEMKFRNEVYKLSSGGARQILRLISTAGTQSR